MAASTMTGQEAPETPSKSFLARLAGVFLSPRETFAAVARKPDFIAPLAVSILASVAVAETMLYKVGAERIIRAGIARSSRASSMTPEQIDEAVARGEKFVAITFHLSGLLGIPLFMLIVAGVGLLILNSVFGDEAKFGAAFAVSCYAGLIYLLSSVMALALVLLGDPEHFNVQTPTPTNLGFFLNPLETSKPLMALATSVDIFSLWFMALLGIGLSEASRGKVKAVSIFLCYFGIWLVIVLVKVGWSVLS